MLGFFVTTLISALGLLVVDLAVPGVTIATFPAALLAAISIGLVNSFIKPVLSVLSLPINLLTLGSFSLIVNGVCFWLAALLVPGFTVHGLLAIVLAPVVLSLASTFLNKYFAQRGIGQSLLGSNSEAVLEAGEQ
ncbi:phage holin family protein [Microcoleus sp. FACHB-SPT15]|uniref:phage holin family protein n=1 Tax=Microcoleus sp. FACHB-SPT15 TaxID=2692830 RepID=UPI00177B415C|nr:phage holin family protein [Microcoleus sp. FACHB-SPT15]MBD1806580.1 phage holin family protein [Microcoleus sp. FACHB-SPT15]